MNEDLINISKDLLTKFAGAARYAAWRIREYDEADIHDHAAKDGFSVTEGHCNQPDCVICELERLLAQVDDECKLERLLDQDDALESTMTGIQIDSVARQTSLMGVLNDSLQLSAYVLGLKELYGTSADMVTVKGNAKSAEAAVPVFY